jgi:hypothetical protein
MLDAIRSIFAERIQPRQRGLRHVGDAANCALVGRIAPRAHPSTDLNDCPKVDSDAERVCGDRISRGEGANIALMHRCGVLRA